MTTYNDIRNDEIEELAFAIENILGDLGTEKLGRLSPTAAGLLAARLHRAGYRRVRGPSGEEDPR